MVVLLFVLLGIFVVLGGLLVLGRLLEGLPDARLARSAEQEELNRQYVAGMIISAGTEGFNGR